MSNVQKQATSQPAGFAKGRFHLTHEAGAEWQVGLRDYFEYRDLGMAEATGGKLRAHVIRPTQAEKERGDLHYHEVEFQMVYVLEGWALMHFEGIGEVRLEKGSCMYQEPGIVHRLIEWSDDYTVVELMVPADPATVTVAP